MKVVSLLPADRYLVINKTILTEVDRKNIIKLYEPIIGSLSVSLYLTLWSDLDRLEIMSVDYTHHHLMVLLKESINSIKIAKETLEAMGLIRTYFKEGDINSYVYELYSPLSAHDFLNHPIFNIVLYNNIGAAEYEILKKDFENVKINLSEYEEITKKLDQVYDSTPLNMATQVRKCNTGSILIDSQVDFDLIMASLPKKVISEKAFNKSTKDLINNLVFIYDLDNIKLCELIRAAINEKGFIEKDELRKLARKNYQFDKGGLPTLVYRTQPDYLKNPLGDNSNRGKLIGVFENTTPYDFLKSKNKGCNPTAHDLKIVESLLIDLELTPAVVNVLIDYVLKKNNNKLTGAFVETIAAQWKRAGVNTATKAMEIAEKEHKKVSNQKYSKKEVAPIWFNQNNQKEDISNEEAAELQELLKEFR